MKKPTIPVMIISSAVAIVLAMLVQGFSFTDCAASMVSGFKMEMLHTSMDLENIVEQVPNLLQRGGMSSMMNTALMAFCGFSFIGALTVCGSMELILERIMKHIHGTGQLITLTVALGVVMITVIGEATVTFLMIGGMFRPEYIKRGLESKNLSRSFEYKSSLLIILTSFHNCSFCKRNALAFCNLIHTHIPRLIIIRYDKTFYILII